MRFTDSPFEKMMKQKPRPQAPAPVSYTHLDVYKRQGERSVTIGQYSVIYADPPWRYAQKGLQGAAEKHYPTMGIDEICALPVADLAAPDSVLFLWATFPQLPEALRLIKAWGFQYKSVAFVWLKKNRKSENWFYGLGFWTRGNAEVCLLATRGHPKRQAANVHQFIIAPVSYTHLDVYKRQPRRKPFIPGLWKPYRSKTKWNICWICCCLGRQRKKQP